MKETSHGGVDKRQAQERKVSHYLTIPAGAPLFTSPYEDAFTQAPRAFYAQKMSISESDQEPRLLKYKENGMLFHYVKILGTVELQKPPRYLITSDIPEELIDTMCELRAEEEVKGEDLRADAETYTGRKFFVAQTLPTKANPRSGILK